MKAPDKKTTKILVIILITLITLAITGCELTPESQDAIQSSKEEYATSFQLYVCTVLIILFS